MEAINGFSFVPSHGSVCGVCGGGGGVYGGLCSGSVGYQCCEMQRFEFDRWEWCGLKGFEFG